MLIISDESNNSKISVVGAISIPLLDLESFEKNCIELRLKHKFFKEMKWNILSKINTPFYSDVIDLFFTYEHARFHSNSYFESKDQYNVSYLLIRSIDWKLKSLSNFDYYIYFDKTTNGAKELKVTKECLENDPSFRSHQVKEISEVGSHVLNIYQITDLLTGCLAYKLNLESHRNRYKDGFIKRIETKDKGRFMEEAALKPYKMWGYYDKKIQHYNLHQKARKYK